MKMRQMFILKNLERVLDYEINSNVGLITKNLNE